MNSIQFQISLNMHNALWLWKEQIPEFQKSIKMCLTKLIPPSDSYSPQKLKELKQQLKQLLKQNNHVWQKQPFLDVVINLIQGYTNMPINSLQIFLTQQLGVNNAFWRDQLLNIAFCIRYTENFCIWQVYSHYQNNIYLAPEKIIQLRRLRNLSKYYINDLQNIIKLINQISKHELDRIDEAYIRLRSRQNKYQAFIQHIYNITTEQEQISNFNTRKIFQVKKKMFIFTQPKKQYKQSNTLFYYNFKSKNKPIEQKRRISSSEMLKIQLVFNNNQSTSFMDDLRQEFQKQSKQQYKYQQDIFITIWNNYYYFEYYGHKIEMIKDINFEMPYKKYENIDYQIDSQEEYDQLLADDINSNDKNSEIYLNSSSASFVVSDGYLSEDQISWKQLKLNVAQGQIQRWIYSHLQILSQNKSQQDKIINLYSEDSPLDLRHIDESMQQLNEMNELIDKKSKKQIRIALQQNKVNISQNKLTEHLKSKFYKIRSKQGLILYHFKSIIQEPICELQEITTELEKNES